MVEFRLPIVMILCVSTLLGAGRRANAGVIEVAVAAAKSPPAKWFAGFAATYLMEKGADWAWDQFTGKPKVEELQAEIRAMEAKYPAYKVYFEALRVNINANTDRRTFEHSIAEIVRKIDQDALVAHRLNGPLTAAPGFPPAPTLATALANGGLSAPALGQPMGSPFSTLSTSGLDLTAIRLNSPSPAPGQARPLPPSHAAAGLLNKSPLLAPTSPVALPPSFDFQAALSATRMTLNVPGAPATPANQWDLSQRLGTSTALPNLGSALSGSALSLQPSNFLYPACGVLPPPVPANASPGSPIRTGTAFETRGQ